MNEMALGDLMNALFHADEWITQLLPPHVFVLRGLKWNPVQSIGNNSVYQRVADVHMHVSCQASSFWTGLDIGK